MLKLRIKSIITVLLVAVLLINSVAITSATQVNEVYRDGAIFEVKHYDPMYPTDGVSEEKRNENHVLATGKLCEAITSITYAEILMFDINILYVGLPYDSVEMVEQIDTVLEVNQVRDKVCDLSPEEKIEDQLSEIIETSNPDDSIEIQLSLSYNTLVYYGFCEEDFSEIDDYISAQRATFTQHFTSKNQKIFDEISKCADVKLIKNSKSVPSIIVETKVSEISKIAECGQVKNIKALKDEEPSNPPIEVMPTDSTPKEYKYKEKFESSITISDYRDYDELYEHINENTGEVEWALITAKINMFLPWDVLETHRIGNRVIAWWDYGVSDFPFALAVYDAKDDDFYGIETVNPEDYSDFVSVIEELKLGYEIGDVDKDGRVSVLDATWVQMYVADLIKEDSVFLQYQFGIGDMVSDGELTILDATAIQQKVANIN